VKNLINKENFTQIKSGHAKGNGMGMGPSSSSSKINEPRSGQLDGKESERASGKVQRQGKTDDKVLG